LEIIHDEIESGALADDIEGIASTSYVPDPRGTDLNCRLSTLDEEVPIPASDTEDKDISSSALLSRVNLGTSFMTVLAAFALTVF